MQAPASWQFELEIHPPAWCFPAGPTWIAGWIFAPPENSLGDLRGWIDHHLFYGLHGLPRPEIEARQLHRAGPPYCGFSLLVKAPLGARTFRLEGRDAAGRWHEIFSTAITTAPDATANNPRPTLAAMIGEKIPALLRLQVHRPTISLATLADDMIAATIAEPLNTLPNPPFCGALEEPCAEGWIRYGRLGITGWLAHRSQRISRLTTMVEPLQEHRLPHGLPRLDINSVFPDLPDRENLAFVGHADLSFAPGLPVLLKIFAELDNGEKHLVFAQRFLPQVILGAAPPLPRLSHRTFTAAAWALDRAARRHGLKRGGLPALGAALKTAWQTYAAEAPVAPPSIRPVSATTLATRATKPLNVVVITHNLNPEGAPWFILEYAHYLARQFGWQVRVISPVDGPLRQNFIAAGLPVEVIDIEPALTTKTGPAFEAALVAVAAQLNWRDIDLVVANTMVSFWGIHLARLAQKPALLYIHESASVRRFFAPRLAPALMPMVEAAFAQANRVIFIAAASRVVFARLEHKNNFRYLPSWIDVTGIQQFAAAHTPTALREQYGYPREAIIFANIGSVCERKGQHVFIQAIAQLQILLAATGEPLPPLQFLMVGARPGNYLEALRHEILRLGLNGVTIVAEVPGTYAFYRLADIFVCSSFEEAFPRVLLEAAAFSRLIVSTNVNGIPEMLAPEDAWLVPPGDAAALAQAMHAALRAHLAGDQTRAARAYATVTTRFAAENSLPLHLAVAQEAASLT